MSSADADVSSRARRRKSSGRTALVHASRGEERLPSSVEPQIPPPVPDTQVWERSREEARDGSGVVAS
jgi:hypothetical protein